VRRQGFFGVIGKIPTGALQLKAAVTNQLFDLAVAELAFSQWHIGDFLEGLENLATLGTFVFVYRHRSYLQY
jgi:hypothetical protein